MRAASLVRLGVAAIAVALAGWLVTMVVVSFRANPATTENLTAAWTAAGPTPLGAEQTVAVPAGSTLVAFLVGTQLNGFSGTTTGSCTASSTDTAVKLSSRVHINRSLSGVLRDGQETVAIAGWSNGSGEQANVRITCQSRDSTVEHFVAVPTRSAVVERNPWFQPWGWLVIGVLGAVLIGAGASRP